MDHIGRPTKLTKALTEKFCKNIRLGLPILDACALCDIEEKTYYNWVNRGEDGEEPYAGFLQHIKKAHAEMKSQCLELMHKAATDKDINWFPLAWKLERRDRLNFGKNDKIDAQINIKVDPKALTEKLRSVESEEI